MKGQENDNKYILLVSLIVKIPKKMVFLFAEKSCIVFYPVHSPLYIYGYSVK